MIKIADVKAAYSNHLIRFLILFYWSVYWLFNSLDKIIGGSQFLWVGKDRFALFERFFASAGWRNPVVADAALITVAGLEIFAFLFFSGAFVYFLLNKQGASRSWFVVGIVLTLAIFCIFSIGDQVFGDHAELLEHTLYWILSLFTWVIFIHSEKFIPRSNIAIRKNQVIMSAFLFVIITVVVNISIFTYKKNAFHQRTDGIAAEQEGDNLYKCTFPFLAGSKSFESTINMFEHQHPDKKITKVYTVPDELREQQADALIIYITTENKK